MGKTNGSFVIKPCYIVILYEPFQQVSQKLKLRPANELSE